MYTNYTYMHQYTTNYVGTVKQGSASNCSWPKEPYAVTTMPFSWHQRTRSLVSDGTWGKVPLGSPREQDENPLFQGTQQRAQR